MRVAPMAGTTPELVIAHGHHCAHQATARSSRVRPGIWRRSGGRAAEVPTRMGVAPLAGTNPVLVIAHGHLWFGSSAGIGRVPLAALHAAADGRAPAPDVQ